jgi:thiosulfate dehydrogenase [quinone] large subunit
MALNLGEKTCLGYLVILRVWIGSYLLYQGNRKFLRDFPHSGWIERQIGKLDAVELFSWYKEFLANVVLPNQELFGYLVMYGEILVGLCLIIGLLVRFSSAVGIFMFINYILGPGWARGASTLGQTETFLVAMIVLFLTNPGRTLGVDGFLFKRR